ncbi:hypothetical protein RND81_09G213500 [Saponaria officinalis]|uniref:Uncharacterized protein n=1 Tax=Saponaria officinalis TaxID=3572 RepID=A0AAW1IPH0_SAPOF
MAKVHAICEPFPAQGHITPMLHFAKLLNTNGVHIMLDGISTGYEEARSCIHTSSPKGIRVRGRVTFPDGLPPTRGDLTQAFPALVLSLAQNGIEHFVNVLRKVNGPASGRPPVTLMIFDCIVPFAHVAARVVPDLPLVFFWPASACSHLGYGQFSALFEKGIVPFKDSEFMTDGSLDKLVDWVPSMKDVRLRDLPSFVRTTDENDPMMQYIISATEWCRGSPIVFNTFNALEHESIEDISKTLANGPIYTVGPLHNQVRNTTSNNESSIGSNLWEKDSKCKQWLDSKNPKSVVYVSFGSVAIMTNDELN